MHISDDRYFIYELFSVIREKKNDTKHHYSKRKVVYQNKNRNETNNEPSTIATRQVTKLHQVTHQIEGMITFMAIIVLTKVQHKIKKVKKKRNKNNKLLNN